MRSPLSFVQKQLRREPGLARRRSVWILAAMLIGLTLVHYLTPQVRPFPLTLYFLERHAVERIIFLMPIAGATFAFGQVGGLVTLTLAIFIMLPRVFFMSSYPGDALAETLAVSAVGGAMIWMIETQESEKRLRQKAVLRLRAINAVASILTESLELEQILSGSLAKVLQVMGIQAGAIFLLDRPGQELVLAASQGLEQAADSACRLKVGQCYCGQAAQSGEMMVVEDTCPAPCPVGLAMQKEGLQAQLIVPLKSKGEAQGVLVALRTARTACQFHPDELDLATVIGNEVGVAIENARLHQDIARQLQVEQRLNQVAEEITSELELDNILPKVLKIAQELLNAEAGGIGLLDRDKHLIRYPYLSNLPQELARVTVPKEEGMSGQVIATGRPIIIHDYANYSAAIPSFARAGLTSVVGVPIVSGDQLYGVLFVGNLGRAARFSERDVAILAGVGRQAGIAIENAYLYENMRFYVRQITRAQEDERKRIARDLHDDTIQALVAFSRRLDALRPASHADREQWPAAALERIGELQDQMDEVIKGVRRFSQALRPSVLDDLGLLPALEGLVSLTEQAGIQTRFEVLGDKRRFSPEAELTLFRIAQEALTNVRKHAGATRVAVAVEFTDGAVRLTLQDNGKGFSPPALTGDLAAAGKLGLVGMYERARLLGGTLQVHSEAGLGTRITVSVPIER
jgi:signal transduction histidine kinase